MTDIKKLRAFVKAALDLHPTMHVQEFDDMLSTDKRLLIYKTFAGFKPEQPAPTWVSRPIKLRQLWEEDVNGARVERPAGSFCYEDQNYGRREGSCSERKLEAIKCARQLTGMGLKEAKDWVEGSYHFWADNEDQDKALFAAFTAAEEHA